MKEMEDGEEPLPKGRNLYRLMRHKHKSLGNKAKTPNSIVTPERV